MGSNHVRAAFIAILQLFSLLGAAQAQQPAARSDQPDLSEQMTATQFRHIKLWFAGKLGNWKLAAYELDLIASSLEAAAKRTPAGAPASQIPALRNAIDAKDATAFPKAYAELTNACNACPRAAGRGFISVQVP